MFKRMLFFLAFCALAVIAVFFIKGYIDGVRTEARNAVLVAEGHVTVLEGQINAEHRAVEKKNTEIKELNRFSNAVLERLKIEKYANQDLRAIVKGLKEEVENQKIAIAALEEANKGDIETLKIALERNQEKIKEIKKLEVTIQRLNIKLVEKDEQIEALNGAIGIWTQRTIELQQQLEKTKKRGLFTVIGTAIAGAIGWLL